MEFLFSFLFALLGLAVGSFLNVCIDRFPRDESILNPPSHCEVCHHNLAAKDLIPLFSYLFLRGRCRYCRTPLPKRLPLVELATGVILALLCASYGLSLGFGILSFYACLFIVVFVTDLEQGVIPNKVIYLGMAAALLFAFFLPQPWLEQWWFEGIANFAFGGGIGFGLLFLLAIISRGGMGWGDVKLAALIGLATGFPLVLFALIIGAIMGGLIGMFLLATKKKRRKEMIPFGPFLSLAAFITLLWGSNILSWWLLL